jgi:uncharacterized repeat protein (TIGR01451 family)
VFLIKLDSVGNFIWVQQYGSTTDDEGQDILIDATDNIYIIGDFEGTVDFDPSVNTHSLTSFNGNSDVFIQKLDSTGSFIWAKSFGGLFHDYAYEIIQDKIGDIYITGDYTGQVDFDPGVGSFLLTSLNSEDIYIEKLDSSGNFIWAKSFGGSDLDIGYGMFVDLHNDLYITGEYSDLADLDPGPAISNHRSVGGTDIFIEKLNSNGELLWVNTMGTGFNDHGRGIWVDTSNCVYTIGSFYGMMDFDPGLGTDTRSSGTGWGYYVQKLNQRGVSGYVFHDVNQNCQMDGIELGLPYRALMIQPGNIVTMTNEKGLWSVDSLPIGTYTITVDTSGSWKTSCSPSQTFTVVDPDSIMVVPYIGMYTTDPCPSPDISVFAPILRPGFSSQKIYIQAANTYLGTGPIDSPYVVFEIDPLFTVQASSAPSLIILGPNKFRVNLDTLFPGEKENFTFSGILSNRAVLGQTICMSAKLYPVDSCALDTISQAFPTGTISPCFTEWDGSSLQVQGTCINDSIHFVVYNNGLAGIGDMSCRSPVLLYIDGQLVLLDSVQLAGGDSSVFAFSGDGRTWRMEVLQHPQHPGNSNPNATVERCGNIANWTSGLVNILPADDADPVIDIYCVEVRGSYDPNDKRGFPKGVGTMHEIQPNQDLEYVIRFQNTGTDTAFTVVIRDTLSQDLDLFSFNSGVASHNYSFRMYGPRILEWTFNNIMLPDSNVNEIESHGFITFRVDLVDSLLLGTVIENSAAIYFDYNAPIITNTSMHTLSNLQLLNWDGQATVIDTVCNAYYFGMVEYNQTGTYFQSTNNTGIDSLYTLDLTINHLDNDIQLMADTLMVLAPNIDQSYQWLDCNNANASIPGATNFYYVPTANGDYAVQIVDSNCTVLSDCMNYTLSTIDVVNTTEVIHAFPNPTNGNLIISKKMDSPLELILSNHLGQVLKTQKMERLELTLDMKDLSGGVYYLFAKGLKNNTIIKVVKY